MSQQPQDGYFPKQHPEHKQSPEKSDRVSRRALIRKSAGALGTGAAAFAASSALLAQQPAQKSPSPPNIAGRKMRAFLRTMQGASVQEVKLLPLREDMVAIRTEATQCCYTIINQALGSGNNGIGGAGGTVAARILGHGGVGIVEAVGSAVKRVQPGDRVLVTNTPNCGECYDCLRGRGDMCQMNPAEGEPLVPVAELADGTPVHQHNNTGGFAEMMITYDWYCVPTVSKLSAAELAMLGCVGATGLGSVTAFVPVRVGSNVVVLGAGPVGLSAVQGARIQGASKIIVVEPIRARRELALKLGATVALDPNVEGNNLVAKVRELCTDTITRKRLGGRDRRPGSEGTGADYVIATVGADFAVPKVEKGPDPTALLPTRQAWEMTRSGGNLITLGLPRGEVSFPAGNWSNRGRIHHAGQYGGVNAKSDVPRFVQMIDQGRFDAKAMATSIYTLDQTKDAFQAVADRTTVGAVVVFA
jgi:S-(hydroxymethyl)glutathione dehydrogenase / alcohol dehydrogenase